MTDPVAEVLSLVAAAPARLGHTKLIAVDGPAGSGKSTLARAVAKELKGRVLKLDALYDGWAGLTTLDKQVVPALRPLVDGDEGYYRRYDWESGSYRETRRVLPVPHLVLDGVGAGGTAWAPWTSVLVWVECPDPAERLRRWRGRDGDRDAAHWEQWMRDEEDLFAREGTKARADLVVQT